MSIKRTIIVTAAILASVAMVAPSFAGAITIDELMAQIALLQQQLLALQGPGSTPVPNGNVLCAGITFSRNLVVGSTGSDVKCLQVLMNNNGFTLAQTGAGSPGMETSYFGPRTLAVIRAFQASKGWTPANQVGPLTRQALNALINGGTPPIIPSTGGLSVGLASDTPASTTVATGGSAKFTKLNLTAGSAAVTVSKLYVTRSGLSANTDILNIKVVDAVTGGYIGNIGSLNSDNKAIMSFYPAITVNAGQTRSFYLQASILSSASAGRTAVLGVASASDVVSNATSVTGSFPVNGNAMSVVSLTIGELDIAVDGTTSDATPNVGEVDVVVDQFKLTASSTEDITVETITAKRTGSASATDTANIELYDVTNNRTVATVAAWDAYDTAVFSNLNLLIAKGKTVRYKIMVDVVGGAGSSKTVNTDLIDGTDVLIAAKGNSYGYYIAPTIISSFSGKGSSDQTIANGSLTISKSASTPATGKVASGSDVVLGRFDFDAKGEDVKITAMKVLATSGVHTWADSDIKSVSVYDAAGSLVAGPKDVASMTAVFTDTFVVPVGVHTYTVKATIADSVATSDTINVRIMDPTAAGFTATGMRSNDTIVPSPASAITANTLTISGAALTVTTLGSPASKSVPKGTSDFIFATFSLDAGAAGEDIKVTSITVTDSLGTAAAAGDIDNAELWADLTSASSVRGDVYETIISGTKQPSAATTAFTMTPTLTVPKGTFVKVALVADLNSGATTAANYTFYVTTGGVSGNGGSTGNALVDGTSTSYVTASKQTMTASAGGTLTVTVDTTSPVADIILGNTNGVTLGVFRLAADNVENLDLDQITFSATNGTYASTLYFYNGTQLLGSIPGADHGTVVFADGTLTILANSYKLITVKADLMDIDGTTRTNGATVKIGVEGTSNIQTTGLLSGQAANSTIAKAGSAMLAYKAKPIFALSSGQPATQINPLANQLVAKFDITATSGDDITFIGGTNALKLYVYANIADTAQNQMTFKITDSDGNTLDSAIQAAASNSTKAMSTTVLFPFATNNLTISAGATKTIYVYSDLSDFEDAGDSIQVYFSSADTATNFSINSNSGQYAEGAKIFRNNIYGNTLSRTN